MTKINKAKSITKTSFNKDILKSKKSLKIRIIKEHNYQDIKMLSISFPFSKVRAVNCKNENAQQEQNKNTKYVVSE